MHIVLREGNLNPFLLQALVTAEPVRPLSAVGASRTVVSCVARASGLLKRSATTSQFLTGHRRWHDRFAAAAFQLIDFILPNLQNSPTFIRLQAMVKTLSIRARGVDPSFC